MILGVALLAAGALAGCSDDAAPGPSPAASAASPSGENVLSTPGENVLSASPSPLATLTPPPAVAGELSRTVIGINDGHPDTVTTVLRNARAGQEYRVEAACSSAVPGRMMSFEVRSGKPGASTDALVSAAIGCDGTPALDDVGELPAEPIVVDLRGDQPDVVSGYAVIAPVASLPAG